MKPFLLYLPWVLMGHSFYPYSKIPLNDKHYLKNSDFILVNLNVCDLHIHTDDHIMVEYEFTVNCETWRSSFLLKVFQQVGSSFSEKPIKHKMIVFGITCTDKLCTITLRTSIKKVDFDFILTVDIQPLLVVLLPFSWTFQSVNVILMKKTVFPQPNDIF